jgi:REP element-mobilizing transposase RayT
MPDSENSPQRSNVEAASRRLPPAPPNLHHTDPASTPDSPPTSDPIPITYFDPASPIADLTGNLPHWRQDGTTYFVTFRLADSLPQEKLTQWRREQNEWLRQNPGPHTPAQREEYFDKFPRRLQSWLDAGRGSRILEIPAVNQLVHGALRFFDGQRYQLDELTVASNHVHVIVTPFAEFELSQILHSWKSFTAHQILKIEAASRRLQGMRTEASRGEIHVAAGSRERPPTRKPQRSGKRNPLITSSGAPKASGSSAPTSAPTIRTIMALPACKGTAAGRRCHNVPLRRLSLRIDALSALARRTNLKAPPSESSPPTRKISPAQPARRAGESPR